jgi:hypothetical protein
MLSREKLEAEGLITNKTPAVYDPLFTKLLKGLPWASWFESEDPLNCRLNYLETYSGWIQKTQLNKVLGLERFHRTDLINGTTQTFDEAYFKYASKRLRVFRGEYAYHRRVFLNHAFIEDEPLASNDFVIVSAPFCSSGEVHPRMQRILDQAHELKIPVIVDAAYFGTCYGLTLDFTHPAIESVSFSLTKGSGLGHIRSGIRFSNLDDQNPICQQNNYNHTILAAAKIGLHMMANLEPDHIPLKYMQIQQSLCQELGLHASPCIHLALGDDAWEAHRIDGRYNRIGLTHLIRERRKGLL